MEEDWGFSWLPPVPHHLMSAITDACIAMTMFWCSEGNADKAERGQRKR